MEHKANKRTCNERLTFIFGNLCFSFEYFVQQHSFLHKDYDENYNGKKYAFVLSLGKFHRKKTFNM